MVVLTAGLFTRKSVGSKVKCLSRAEGGKECCHGDLTSASSWSISVFSSWMKFIKTECNYEFSISVRMKR